MRTSNMILIILETIYNYVIYFDPSEQWGFTRWLWRKLSAVYDFVEPVI